MTLERYPDNVVMKLGMIEANKAITSITPLWGISPKLGRNCPTVGPVETDASRSVRCNGKKVKHSSTALRTDHLRRRG